MTDAADVEVTGDEHPTRPGRRATVVGAAGAALLVTAGLVVGLAGRPGDETDLVADAASPPLPSTATSTQAPPVAAAPSSAAPHGTTATPLPSSAGTTHTTHDTDDPVATPAEPPAASPSGAARPVADLPTPTAPGLPGAGSLDGYETLLGRSLGGGYRVEAGSWRIDPCSEFSEPAYAAPELVDYLATRAPDDEVTIGVHRDVADAGSVLRLLEGRVAECGAAEHPIEGVWTATAVDGLGEEAIHLHAVYEGGFHGTDPTAPYRVRDIVLTRVANVVVAVDVAVEGTEPEAPPLLALPGSLRTAAADEVAAVSAHLRLTG